jgi:hypothetical protein
LGLLIEEQRSNLLTYSAQCDDAYWVKTFANGSVQANVIVSPNGTLTGELFSENTTASVSHQLESTAVSASASTFYTASLYVKSAGRNLQINLSDISFAGNVWNFDLSAVTATLVSSGWSNSSASITDVGNGWRRLRVTGQTGASVTQVQMQIRLLSGIALEYTGNGYSGIYIWGAQLEAGAFPTSYIPTVAATVTRNADAASMTGTNFSSWYRADEGAMYAEATTYSTPSYASILSINDSALPANNRFAYGIQSNVTNLYVITNGSVVVDQITSGGTIMTNGVFGRSSYTYKVNDFAISGNGAAVGTDTSGGIPIVNQLFIGNDEVNRRLNGYIKKLAYYPARLTNAQLQALTV